MIKKKYITLILVVVGICLLLLFVQPSSNPSKVLGGWKLISYGTTQALEGVNAYVVFGSDADFVGNVGCNSFSGDYEDDGKKLTISSLAITEMACTDPDIMAQESAVVSFLNDAIFDYDIVGNFLILHSSNDNIKFEVMEE